MNKFWRWWLAATVVVALVTGFGAQASFPGQVMIPPTVGLSWAVVMLILGAAIWAVARLSRRNKRVDAHAARP